MLKKAPPQGWLLAGGVGASVPLYMGLIKGCLDVFTSKLHSTVTGFPEQRVHRALSRLSHMVSFLLCSVG